jgi:glycosyltransferase involved in cell wall biosynthesis
MTSVHPWDDTRIYNKMCRSLSTYGHSVTLLAPIEKFAVKHGVRVLPVKKAPNRILRMLIASHKILKIAWQIDADIYHFHDPELIFVGYILRKSGKKVVYDVHEDYSSSILSNDSIPKVLRKILSKLTCHTEQTLIPQLSGIVCATNGITEKLSTFNSNVITVNNYPILSGLSPVQTTEQGSSVNHPFRLIYAGSISKARGIVELVNAVGIVNQSDSCKLVLCGKYSPQDLESVVTNLPGYKHVEFLGQLSRSELQGELQQSQVGVVLFHPEPNHVESQPNKLYEYMEAGLPVLASNFDMWKRFIEINNIGTVTNPLDPKQIAFSIIQIMANYNKFQRMGINGNRLVNQKYNWDVEKLKLVDIYTKLQNNQ